MGVVIPFEGSGSERRASIDPLVQLTFADMQRVNESILSHARKRPGHGIVRHILLLPHFRQPPAVPI